MPQAVDPCHETDGLFVTLEHFLPPTPPVKFAEEKNVLPFSVNLPFNPVCLQISHEMGDSVDQILESLQMSQVHPNPAARCLGRTQVEREDLPPDLYAVISDYLLQTTVEVTCMWTWNAQLPSETVGRIAEVIRNLIDVGIEHVADDRDSIRC